MSAPGRFLSRWSRLKLAPVEAEPEKPAEPAPVSDVLPSAAATAEGKASAEIDQTAAPTALPDVASLALDSDFTAFLKDEVSERLRRQALKKLFNDPHFNVMDGLDIYIDDYSVSTPIPPELLAKLRSAAEWLAGSEEKDGSKTGGEPLVTATEALPVAKPDVPERVPGSSDAGLGPESGQTGVADASIDASARDSVESDAGITPTEASR
jgi:hypothetical protein